MGVEAVVFDYGRTLVTFEYPTDELRRVVESFLPAIAEATGNQAPEAEEIMQRVLLPLEAVVESPMEDEVLYFDVYAAAWRDAGFELPDGLLYEILDAEQRVWDASAVVDPAAVETLTWLKSRGIRRAICSNAPFPADMMLRQVQGNGLAHLMDAVVFSSQAGKRKPAPDVYHATLAAIDVAPASALFVGDREREDYDGPTALGMRAVICTAHAASPPREGIPTISSLSELPAVL